MRKWILNVMIVIVAICYTGTAQAQPYRNTKQSHLALQQFVQSRMDEIATQPAFQEWKSASYDLTPLGPGTHSWLVLVQHEQLPAGYLVVHAVEGGGYQLGEYGRGDLYSDASLQLAKQQLSSQAKVLHLYIHPLLAAWQIGNQYADGMSGEELPINQQQWTAAVRQEKQWAELALQDANRIDHAIEVKSFDPFTRMPWLTKAPLSINAEEPELLTQLLEQHNEIRYTANRFDSNLFMVWSVTGIHQWSDGTVYAAIETENGSSTNRYVPVSLLLKLGRFYK